MPPTELSREEMKKLGLRERGRYERKRRIIRAARDVIIECGYDAATTREIAERAEVAIGTIFLYAPDKRDLLFLVLNDELDQVVENAFAAVPEEQPLLAKLMTVFTAFYQYFAQNMTLGRYALRELEHYTSRPLPDTVQAKVFRARQQRILDLTSDLIRQAQRENEISSTVDAALLASLCFSNIYMTEVRKWLNSEDPRLEDGLGRLRRLLNIVFAGLQVQSPGIARVSAAERPKRTRAR